MNRYKRQKKKEALHWVLNAGKTSSVINGKKRKKEKKQFMCNQWENNGAGERFCLFSLFHLVITHIMQTLTHIFAHTHTRTYVLFWIQMKSLVCKICKRLLLMRSLIQTLNAIFKIECDSGKRNKMDIFNKYNWRDFTNKYDNFNYILCDFVFVYWKSIMITGLCILFFCFLFPFIPSFFFVNSISAHCQSIHESLNKTVIQMVPQTINWKIENENSLQIDIHQAVCSKLKLSIVWVNCRRRTPITAKTINSEIRFCHIASNIHFPGTRFFM